MEKVLVKSLLSGLCYENVHNIGMPPSFLLRTPFNEPPPFCIRKANQNSGGELTPTPQGVGVEWVLLMGAGVRGSGEAHPVSDFNFKNRCPCPLILVRLLIALNNRCLSMFDAGDF